jgi:RNA polymerase-binding transcription factor
VTAAKKGVAKVRATASRPAKKAAPKGAAKPTPAKAASKSAVAKSAVAKKAVPAKKAPPKKAPPKKAPAAKKAASARPTTAKAAPAKKATAAKKAPAKKGAVGARPAAAPAAKSEAPPKKVTPKKAAPAKKASIGPYAKDEKFLAEQRDLLLGERSVYEGQAHALRAEADSLALEREPGDVQFDEESGEGGTVTVDRERNLALSAQAGLAVEEIDDALRKIERRTYGACERCHQPIPKARLRALPFARLCVACKSGGLSRR